MMYGNKKMFKPVSGGNKVQARPAPARMPLPAKDKVSAPSMRPAVQARPATVASKMGPEAELRKRALRLRRSA